jgi:hypothetical protein
MGGRAYRFDVLQQYATYKVASIVVATRENTIGPVLSLLIAPSRQISGTS